MALYDNEGVLDMDCVPRQVHARFERGDLEPLFRYATTPNGLNLPLAWIMEPRRTRVLRSPERLKEITRLVEFPEHIEPAPQQFASTNLLPVIYQPLSYFGLRVRERLARRVYERVHESEIRTLRMHFWDVLRSIARLHRELARSMNLDPATEWDLDDDDRLDPIRKEHQDAALAYSQSLYDGFKAALKASKVRERLTLAYMHDLWLLRNPGAPGRQWVEPPPEPEWVERESDSIGVSEDFFDLPDVLEAVQAASPAEDDGEVLFNEAEVDVLGIEVDAVDLLRRYPDPDLVADDGLPEAPILFGFLVDVGAQTDSGTFILHSPLVTPLVGLLDSEVSNLPDVDEQVGPRQVDLAAVHPFTPSEQAHFDSWVCPVKEYCTPGQIDLATIDPLSPSEQSVLQESEIDPVPLPSSDPNAMFYPEDVGSVVEPATPSQFGKANRWPRIRDSRVTPLTLRRLPVVSHYPIHFGKRMPKSPPGRVYETDVQRALGLTTGGGGVVFRVVDGRQWEVKEIVRANVTQYELSWHDAWLNRGEYLDNVREVIQVVQENSDGTEWKCVFKDSWEPKGNAGSGLVVAWERKEADGLAAALLGRLDLNAGGSVVGSSLPALQ
ncbi:hypothetical protein P7C70_g3126, partial [Phenoliferia sp. Uapishka_3]